MEAKREKEPVLIKCEVTIRANTDGAWAVLGPGYAEISSWSSDIKQSGPMDLQSLNGSTCTLRKCKVKGLGTVEEKLVVYSGIDHQLKYEVVNGMPGIVKYVSGSWILTDAGNGTTNLTIIVEMKTSGFLGGLLKGAIRRKMNRLYEKAAEEFKYVVEKGTPHPRKTPNRLITDHA
jgi:hypothetical protein